jgi:hypothetical protein
VVALVLLALPGAALAQGQDEALVVAAGEQVAGSVATVSRDIRVDGVVAGDVTSWNGSITIAGTVGGDVVTYGGAVTVTATGRVAGHILASGGGLRVEPGASVAGQAIGGGGGGALASLLDLFMPAAETSEVGPAGHALFGTVIGVLLAAFCVLLVALWPRRVLIAGATLRRLPGRAAALGLLATAALALALAPVAGLLVASVIGVPLLVALLALALAPFVYGLAVLAHAAGAGLAVRAGGAPSQGRMGTLAALALALPIAVVVALAPIWALALFYLLASPGLGAVLLSRGGLMLPLAAR